LKNGIGKIGAKTQQDLKMQMDQNRLDVEIENGILGANQHSM
jgi:hypothetical protein